MKKTGIFGGSFNPIHCGHIALATTILQQCDLDEVWLMVSPQNPLKRQADLLDDGLRLRLARKALRGVDGIRASDYEFRLPKPSYTWHTLESLRNDYPQRQFSLIIGGDNWQVFDRWYRADDILRAYPVIVYPRPDSEVPTPRSIQPQVVDAPLLDVSSTDIRRRVCLGESIHQLVPEAIEADVIKLYTP